MRRFARFLGLLAVVVLLSGCMALDAQVATYYRAPLNLVNKTYAYYPMKQLGQSTDPQYEYLTTLVDSILQPYGLKKTNLSRAHYIVTMTYGMGHPQSRTGYRDVYGKVGNKVVERDTTRRFNPYTGTFVSKTRVKTEPKYGVVGQRQYNYTVYPYHLLLRIYRRNAIPHPLQSRPVYTAKVSTFSRWNNPARIYPALVQAVAKSFPGANGGVNNVVVSLDSKP